MHAHACICMCMLVYACLIHSCIKLHENACIFMLMNWDACTCMHVHAGICMHMQSKA